MTAAPTGRLPCWSSRDWRSSGRSSGGIGAAARTGLLAASGVYRALVDPGWSVAPEQLQLALPPAITGFDVAIGSRHVIGAQRKGEPLTSLAIGRLLNRLVQGLVVPGIRDTQAPLKVYRAEAARALFSRVREDGPAAEIEALALARVFGLHVREVPVDWSFEDTARWHPFVHGPAMFAALLRIRARLTAGAYPPLRASPDDELDVLAPWL